MNTLVMLTGIFLFERENSPDRRTVTGRMDADKILRAETLQKAIDYFQSQVNYIKSVENFESFMIDGQIYYANHWKSLKLETSQT
jgi:hypothetical protein